MPGRGPTCPTPRRSSRLAGVTDTHELARYPDPLSPEAAARVSGLPPLDLAHAAEYIGKLADSRDLVLVEGAGGLLVRYDAAGATLADLAAMCAAPVLVVVAAGLGTLNHTALTCEALAARRLELRGGGDRPLARRPGPGRAGERWPTWRPSSAARWRARSPRAAAA